MLHAAFLMGWWSGGRCCAVIDAVLQIIAPVNVKRLHGQITRRNVMNTLRRELDWILRNSFVKRILHLARNSIVLSAVGIELLMIS